MKVPKDRPKFSCTNTIVTQSFATKTGIIKTCVSIWLYETIQVTMVRVQCRMYTERGK